MATSITIRRLGERKRRVVVPPEDLAWEGRDWAVTREPGLSWRITHRPTGYALPLPLDRGQTKRGLVRLAMRLDREAPRFRTLTEAKALANIILAVRDRIADMGRA